MNHPAEQITISPLFEDGPIPMLILPRQEQLVLSEWARTAKDYVNDLLQEHGALLFRGFSVSRIPGFEAFIGNVSDGECLRYVDRSTPREARGDRVYTATIYPPEYAINLHNEGTYWTQWPINLFFYCGHPPQTGGETPIADVINVLDRIDPDVREKFREKKIMYVRNYNRGLGLPWEEVFQTQDQEEVEEYCAKNSIEFEWCGRDKLRTRQIRPAIQRNPRTNSEVWFNHGAFFNIQAHEPAIRNVLLRSMKVEDLPYNTYYGDGEPIAPEVVDHIMSAYSAEKVKFTWEQDDVLALENMNVAHARESFTGRREVLVAMTKAYSG